MRVRQRESIYSFAIKWKRKRSWKEKKKGERNDENAYGIFLFHLQMHFLFYFFKFQILFFSLFLVWRKSFSVRKTFAEILAICLHSWNQRISFERKYAVFPCHSIRAREMKGLEIVNTHFMSKTFFWLYFILFHLIDLFPSFSFSSIRADLP